MKYLKPIFIELRGKSPAIVLKDANLERAASLIVRGAFLHYRQICVSTERVIVVKAVAEKLIALITTEAEKIQHARAAVSERISSYAKGLVTEAVAKGAKAIVGGPGYIDTNVARPTILMSVTLKMKIYDKESFGLSCSIYVVKTETKP